jgi:uroporphyrin-III C-methyltransferase/precorrin-2 dehydrogenase/sirohydrochlorin ferrochelatase/uroporphyrin-III C-methyltransferase
MTSTERGARVPDDHTGGLARRYPARRSCVYLVGAGPGDPGLLTVKALCLISQADVVLYDRLVSDEVMGLVPPGVPRIFVGKQTGCHPVPQPEINGTLVRLARAGRRVVRLKGGDPFLFGRGAEEALHLADHGVDFEVVPGISSASACTAYAGIPLTHRDYAQGVVFVTGHGRSGRPLEREIAEHYARNPNATIVVFMGLARIQRIAAALIRGGMSPDMPAALIARGTTEAQRRVLTTLRQAADDAAGLGTPALIVVGRVVELAGRLDWFLPVGERDSERTQSGN